MRDPHVERLRYDANSVSANLSYKPDVAPLAFTNALGSFELRNGELTVEPAEHFADVSSAREQIDAARGARAAAAYAPHALPRGIRTPPCTACGDHAGRPRSWRSAGRGCRAAGVKTRCDALGATAQARVRDRHRALPP